MKKMRKELGIGTAHLRRLMKSLPPETTTEIRPPPPIDQEIIDQASNIAKQKIASSLSEQIHSDYIGSMKAAAVLKSAEMRYRRALEEMGWDWDDFLEQAIAYGFAKAKERERLKVLMELVRVREVI